MRERSDVTSRHLALSHNNHVCHLHQKSTSCSSSSLHLRRWRSCWWSWTWKERAQSWGRAGWAHEGQRTSHLVKAPWDKLWFVNMGYTNLIWLNDWLTCLNLFNQDSGTRVQLIWLIFFFLLLRCLWSEVCCATWSSRGTSRSPAGCCIYRLPARDTWPVKSTASSRLVSLCTQGRTSGGGGEGAL